MDQFNFPTKKYDAKNSKGFYFISAFTLYNDFDIIVKTNEAGD